VTSIKPRKVLPYYGDPLKNKLNVLSFNDTMKINYDTGIKNDFGSPSIKQLADQITTKHPTVDVQTKTTASTIAIVHWAKETIVNIAAGQNMTVSVDATSESVAGDTLVLNLANDAGGARTITFGTGLTAPLGTIVGIASKTASITFKHNGTGFIETGRSVATS